jgi:hypothetical protein
MQTNIERSSILKFQRIIEFVSGEDKTVIEFSMNIHLNILSMNVSFIVSEYLHIS